ncbi:hypothetical protein [Arcobacter sp. LA11]|uniref:hypothetical protein n=1 Tax=Arcobacter sp. LA11 TaxID=1898176 RepID=UPI000932CA02|nr:hypothetical protein [Arcobacter sp. LA11]
MNNNNNILNFAKVFIVVDLCLIVFSITFYDLIWFLNTQVAFIGSLSVTIASFLSYRKNINNRISNLDTSKNMMTEDRDKIDEIDDPYDLYTEYEEIPEEELTPEKIKEIIDHEKKNVKKNSFKNTLFSAGGFVSIYRVIGYAFLIFGFFALNNNKLFLPIPFLVGLGVVPLSVLVAKFVFKTSQE